MQLLQTLLQHALAIALLTVAVAPWLTTIRRPALTLGQWRLSSYWATIRWQWAFAVLLLLAMPLSEIVYLPAQATSIWRSQPQLVFIVVGNIVAGLYGPIVLAWSHPLFRRQVLAPFAPVQALLPTTPSERFIWAGLSLTTGICEELMFRGFALQYLTRPPFGLSVELSALVTSLLFGLGHAYQGPRGVLKTVLFGAAMWVLLLTTGSLVFPMIVHTLVNLRLALMPTGQRPAPGMAA